jgi:diguanylate cyclase (GGDEF)-like protein/PAS domain S-box-containing protein
MEYPCHSPAEQRWFLAKVTPFKSNRANVVVAHENITERKRTESKLQLAASVFTHAREGIIITDMDANIIDVNNTFTQITGYSHEDVVGKNPRILQSGRQHAEFYADMWMALMKQGFWSGEIWSRRKNGEMYASLLTISAVRDANGRTLNYVGLFTDITPMKEQQRQLEHIAHYDPLTNLPNRVLLADRLQQALNQCQRRQKMLAVVYLDLDGFKDVNDRYGHRVGDDLLVTVSQRMQDAVREGDTLARVGGDEFVAILVDLVQMADCEQVLDRLLTAASKPVYVDDLELTVSVSMGVSLYPQDGSDAELLLHNADQTMYTAKQSGKNRYHVFDKANQSA